MKQILVFVLLAGMLCWLMFSPIYKHVLIVRQAVLQKEVDFLLEIGANASHGYIDDVMINESKLRLNDKGFDVSKVLYTVSTTSGVDGTDPGHPIIRGTGLRLYISYPNRNLFTIDRLMGIPMPSDDSVMSASGLKMSEYLP